MMHTRCPHCQTVFRIRNRELEMASGQVRCGACMRSFDARRHLQATLPLEAEDHRQAELELPADEARERASATAGDADASDFTEVLFEDPLAGRRSRRFFAWGVGNVVLLVVLMVQLVFVQRDAFAHDPVVRPVLAGICNMAGCKLPERRALDRIELTRRNVYSHPNVDGALIIEAEFVNTADFTQPWPLLVISMGNLRGQTLVRRTFRPETYLEAGQRDADNPMSPGQSVGILLEIHDPGSEVRTYDFDFL